MPTIARDLETDNAALRFELERTRAQLGRLEDAKRNFIALTADELRTPLTILFGYAKLLAKGDESKTRDYAGIIVAHCWQLKNTVDAIITLQQCDAGELILRPEVLPLAELIESAVEARHPEITDKALVVKIDVPGDLHVRADRERVQVILAQLLANSIKYAPTAGAISIKAYARQASVVISVRDNGIGIQKDELPHVFDRFYQVGDPLTRQYKGLGLGLAMAKELVELHGGRIWVESTLNQGSTFCFSLPRGLPVQQEAAIGSCAKTMP